MLLTSALRLSESFVFSLSNSSSNKRGLIIASDQSSKTLSLFFVNVLAEPPLNVTETDAPRNSTSSLNLSFGMLVVPFPSIALRILDTPTLLPSRIGFLSIVKLYVTAGSLLSSTTKT